MRRDPRAYLWDALEAVGSVQAFTSGLTLQDYRDDLLRRSAVERQHDLGPLASILRGLLDERA